ncbi:MAG: iron donor protein CyaY [Planctomycetes bacterium]|nr:iron donor protein CyaY [Planctomycetota bacterium]
MTTSADQQFLAQADACLHALQAALDAFDPDELEADLAGGVLRIRFSSNSICIANRQAAAHQIWLAEGASAWHFVYDAAQKAWIDTKGRGKLHTILGEIVSRRLGRAVCLPG